MPKKWSDNTRKDAIYRYKSNTLVFLDTMERDGSAGEVPHEHSFHVMP